MAGVNVQRRCCRLEDGDDADARSLAAPAVTPVVAKSRDVTKMLITQYTALLLQSIRRRGAAAAHAA